MYESPIGVIYGEITTSIENEIYKAVQDVGILVNKDELLKALQYDREQYDKGYADGFGDGYGDGKSVVNQWIPVSERLPEKQMDVIVTVSFDDSIFTDSDEWRNEFCAYGKYVVAWMPLPEPWKGKEE